MNDRLVKYRCKGAYFSVTAKSGYWMYWCAHRGAWQSHPCDHLRSEL